MRIALSLERSHSRRLVSFLVHGCSMPKACTFVTSATSTRSPREKNEPFPLIGDLRWYLEARDRAVPVHQRVVNGHGDLRNIVMAFNANVVVARGR